MKRILSLVLCVLMLIPCFLFSISAEELSDEYKNFALDDGASAYATSKWNDDSNPKYINNDTLDHPYWFWRPDGVGRTPVDDTEQYCGIKFSAHYYELDKIEIYIKHEGEGNKNNYKITVEALVLGEWIEIGTARAWDGVVQEDLNSTDKVTIEAFLPDGTKPVTKNVRVRITEYGRFSPSNKDLIENHGWTSGKVEDDPNTPDVDESKTPTTWHDWWKVPEVQELQTWGTEAPAPPWDVPDGAVLSTNACLSGFASASSSYTTRAIYPALVNDNLVAPTPSTARPYWMAYSAGSGQSVWCEFDQPYDIVNVSLNFGASVDGVAMKFDIQIKIGNDWVEAFSGQTATSSVELQDNIVYALPEIKRASGVKVIFTEVTDGQRATLTEMGALISPDNLQRDENGNPVLNEKGEQVILNKCVFLNEFLTGERKESTAIGNLACFGNAYASSVMTYSNISALEYINDGKVQRNESFSWFANTFTRGTYCGVVLKDIYNVNKVVLNFEDPITGDVRGDHVMQFDIQVKDSKTGEFITVKRDVTSYDQVNKEYIVSVVFDAPVATDDVRIVFTSNAMIFPYIKELEVYASDFVYQAYRGYQMGQRVNGGKTANVATDFAKKTATPRSKYLDKISPIQYFELAMEYGLDILAWL